MSAPPRTDRAGRACEFTGAVGNRNSRAPHGGEMGAVIPECRHGFRPWMGRASHGWHRGVLRAGTRGAATFTGLAALITITGCGELPSGGRWDSRLDPPPHPAAGVARLRGTVDLAAGTLSFDPVPPAGSAPWSGLNAAVYGDQGVTVRIYNSPVVTGLPLLGKKTYSANVGVRNLLGFRVGDEQNAAAPSDTMGIYVFMSSGPTVTGTSSPCACAVTVMNRDGTLGFSAPAQGYWYWKEFLGPAGGGADTTLKRKPWVFEADTQVTNFSFEVLVSAPWVAPNESVWRVEYPGDSLPDTQAEPHWRKYATPLAVESVVANALTLTTTSAADSLFFLRNDSLSTRTDALFEARFRLNSGGAKAKPQLGLILDDNVKFMAVFVSDSGAKGGNGEVGFVRSTSGGTFLGTAGTIDTISVSSFHTYQIRKFSADSVVVWIDGARRLSMLYADLPPTRSATAASHFIFGARAAATGGNVSTWQYALYQIGRASP